MDLHGRRIIYTDVDVITPENVLDVLSKAMSVHSKNRQEIQYLYDYYKGKQPVLERRKEYREDICNKIVENIANEIVTFKTGYLIGEPVQYINIGDGNDKELADAISKLNSYAVAENKASKDAELVEWFHICGTAYRMVLPDPQGEEDEAPFEIYTLDPRNAFVVYNTGLGNKPVMGVRYVLKDDGNTVYSVYTRNRYFEIMADGIVTTAPIGKITKAESHIYGGIPIIEYPANTSRLGAFEIVLPLLDALNSVQSDRLDSIDTFIQAMLVLKGVDIETEEYLALKEYGGIKLPPDGEAYYLTQELNQAQTQTLVDDIYQTILVICGMPNRNGGSSVSDTGIATIYRDGWSDAEARAKFTAGLFEVSEKEFLRLAINIANTYRNLNLRLSAIDVRFTRWNSENIEVKAQVLTMLLNNPKVHPLLAYQVSNIWSDPNLACSMGLEWEQQQTDKMMKELEDTNDDNDQDAEDDDV